MLFNSISYVIFLPIVFVLYWFVTNKNLKLQNILLLGSSYFFYACWDWRFLFLLIFSTVLDYFTGLKMGESKNESIRKFWFWLSISINLGFLGIFKYYNFFINSFAEAIFHLGFKINPWTLNVILPIGISFYTFHGLSYVIDIYKNRIKAEKSFIDYAVFVSFFPLLVAGPIERATHLLPQIKQKRVFDYTKAVDGLRQILWGLFKKIIIADHCASYANQIFNNYQDYSGSTLFLGAIFFTFQIYGDFSGYSDIALGSARLFGIELLKNFSFPYFSRDIAEFWRRWHISLSTWFRDYLYIPLGGSKGSIWIFIVWGLLNAIYIMPSIMLNTHRNNLDIVAKGKLFPSTKDFFSIILTFGLTVFAWIFFRAGNLGIAFGYISNIFSKSFFTKPSLLPLELLTGILGFIAIEWLGREQNYAIEKLGFKQPVFVRWSFYIFIIFLILSTVGREQQQFIYFQF
jgi:alginate O-acetyltransferase complex protein AlgI